MKKQKPELIKTVDQLGYVLKVNNLLAQCEALNITVDSSSIDVETIQLCYTLREKLKDSKRSKTEDKKQIGGRRGRR